MKSGLHKDAQNIERLSRKEFGDYHPARTIVAVQEIHFVQDNTRMKCLERGVMYKYGGC